MFALSRIGALKSGLATNVQPVTAIFEAWVLFGEVLSVLQAIGGAMVLSGTALMQWIDLRGRKPVISAVTTTKDADTRRAAERRAGRSGHGKTRTCHGPRRSSASSRLAAIRSAMSG